jgi:hypothetical protein
LAIPVVAIAVHFAFGREWMKRGDAATLAGDGDRASAGGDWEPAAASYTAALATMTGESPRESSAVQVALGRSLVMSGQIIEGQERLQKTIDDLDAAGEMSSATATAARAELAAAHYYAAWIMRLEGATAEEWKPEAERARQIYRLLAETHPAGGDSPSGFQQNLEATIRLQQMDLSELLARPLPKNCPCCKQSLSQRKRKQCASRCASSGDGQGQPRPQDARQLIKQESGAGLHSGSIEGS